MKTGGPGSDGPPSDQARFGVGWGWSFALDPYSFDAQRWIWSPRSIACWRS